MKKPLRKTKKCTLFMSFKHILHSGQVMIRHPKGRKQYPLAILFPPDNINVPVNLTKIKKISPFCKTPIQSLTKQNIC